MGKSLNKNPQRFWEKVSKVPMSNVGKKHGCWEWTASVDGRGYGKLWWGGHLVGAHRISYMLHHDLDSLPKVLGDSPAEIMHVVCDNPPCVNPAHLQLGNSMLNNRDKAEKKRHHMLMRETCKYGHPWDKKNTGYLDSPSLKARDGKPHKVRYCKTCRKIRQRENYIRVEKNRRKTKKYKDAKNKRARAKYALEHPDAKLRGPYKRRKTS